VTRSYALPRPKLFAPPRRHVAVEGASLTVREGESVGLVGESGCGKSTLSRAILGLEPVQGGRVLLDGEVTAAPHVPEALRRKMQVVFQDPYGSFNPRHRVGRLVAEPFHLYRETPEDRDARIDRALEDVGLSAADRSKYIHEFSGGQRQRIAIARALVTRPRLIVLDEAVSALDVRVRAQVLDLLAGLQARYGLSYLFISHDLHVVRAVTDRVYVMRKGRIVEEGPTEDVFDRPGTTTPESCWPRRRGYRRTGTGRNGMGLEAFGITPGAVHIGGRWTEVGGLPLDNPSTGETEGEIARGTAGHIDAAVAAARAALHGEWGRLTAAERGRLLARLGALVLEHADRLAEIEAADVGKPLRQARADAVALARYCEFYGGAADKVMGETIPYLAGYTVYTLREPHGVTGHIIPWNYPMQIIGRSVGAALAMGNACVVKPAEEACLTALAFAALAEKAGFPAGAINVVPGSARRRGRRSPGIRA
jgi:ABC-type oligopeptide transport system ATPase subunit